MKNNTILFILTFLLMASCEKGYDCHLEARELTSYEKDVVPYEVGTTTMFTNNLEDTFHMICNQRIYRDSLYSYTDDNSVAACGDMGKEVINKMLLTHLDSDIPFDNSGNLGIDLEIEANPYLPEESVFTIELKSKNKITQPYSFFVKNDDAIHLYEQYAKGDFNYHAIVQCNLEYLSNIEINNFLIEDVYLLSGNFSDFIDRGFGFDSVYYNSTYGILKISSVLDGLNYTQLIK